MAAIHIDGNIMWRSFLLADGRRHESGKLGSMLKLEFVAYISETKIFVEKSMV